MPRRFDGDTAPRRIAIVSDAWHPQINGVVRTLTMIVAELRAAGHQVLVIGPDRFQTLPCPIYPEIRLALRPCRRLAALLADFAPDSLHLATEGPLGLAASSLARRAGWSFTTAYHTRFPDYLATRLRLPRRLSYRWLRRFHGRGAGMMVATPGLAAELAARGFENLQFWSRGVDLARFHPALATPLPFPRPIFLSVGRLAVEKNLPAFLGLALPGTKLVVGDGPARAALMRAHREAHFLGAVEGEALARLYASADVFVFPSRTDTFGLVLLEALASGLPVAAFPEAAPSDVLGAAALGGTRPAVGALDRDLGAAARAALTLDRQQCRRFAEGFSWAASARQFLANLVPLRNKESALMLISFVVPAYNEEALLAGTLAAIRAEIDREGLTLGREAEIIVVNNASTDETGAIARATAGVVVVDEPRKGLVQARFAGFVASAGTLVANIDADTRLPPGWLARVRAEFARDPGLVALSGPYLYRDLSPGAQRVVGFYYRLAYVVYLINHYALKVGAMLQGGNFVVRREAMARLGAANDRFSFYGEDTDLARRLGRIGRVKFTFALPAHSSGRRLKGEGVVTIGLRYSLNFFWATFLKKPFTEEWRDIREPREESS